MKRAALLVGINRYQDPGIQPLLCAEKDAVALEFLLRDRCRFEVTCLINAQATRRAIRDAWEALCEGLSPGDALLFYFAGHGHDLNDGQHALMPFDVRLKDIDDDQDPDLIRVRRLEEKSRSCGASRFLLYDACRTPLRFGTRDANARLADPGARDMEVLIKKECQGQSHPPLAALWACSPGERAYEIPKLGRSVFSLAFENLIATFAQEGRELSLPGEVLGRIRHRTGTLLRENGLAGIQNPMLHANRDRMVLLEEVAGREPSSPTPPPPGPIEPEEGAVYGYGRFVLRELLGRNDKGQTWLADDKLPSPANAPSQVVLKILPPGFPPKDEVTTLLRKEVPKAQRLVHPNIARVQSWHHRPGEPVFCVTEFVPGTHLRNHLAEHPSGRLSSAEVEPLLAQLVSALDFAHTQAGVVHHNLHLGNLYLTPDQQLKVADFQLDLPSPSRSLPAHVLPYASPQKQRGDPATMADDLYAVGAILYHLVTGQPPFAAEQLASGGSAGPARDPRTIRASPLGSPCPISDAAALTLLRCLSRDPLQRPPDAQTLRSWWYFGPPSEEPPQPPPPDPSLLTRTIATLGVMLALLIGVPLLLQSKELQTGLESLVTRFRRLVVQPRPDAAFRIHELRSAESLAKRLGDPTNNIATYLRTRLGPDTLRLLGAWQPDQPLPPRFPTMLLADLNQVVRGESIWDAIRFEGVSLRESTERTLKSKRDEASLPRLNRLLLEDAFPAELTTNAPVPSDDGNGSRGPRDTPHPGTAFRVWVRGVETFDVEAILYQDSPTATDPNRQERLWSNKVPVGKPTIVALAETNAANCSFEAGLGTRHARTWLRMEARSAPGTTQDVVLDFAKHTWELAVTQPLPIELFDHWNNRLVVIDTNRFVLNERPNRDRFPWRMDYSTVRELALHPGNYSVRVLDEAANARRMEATRKPFRIGGSGLVEVELAIEPWRHPHLGHSWAIPRLGLELVPIGGSGGFLAGKTETSVAQFAAFAKETGLIPETLWSIGPNGSERGSRDWRDPFGLDNPNLPVVGVSWHEAIRYCEWLTESERRAGRLTARQRFALPTDAQWSQYGGTNKYPWGETFPPRRVHGVYATSSLRNEPWWPKAWEDFYVGTADEAHPPRVVPVHLGPVGPHGLVNVGGNVAEWCGSAFVASMYRATDWTIPSERLRRASSQDGYKTVRGASWFDHDPDMLRTETRWAELPDTRNDRIGFRIVLVQDP